MCAALKLAVIYPLMLMLAQWALTNQPTGIADFTFLQPAPWYVRAAAIGLAAAHLLMRLMAAAHSKGVFETLSNGPLWIVLALAVALACKYVVVFVFALGIFLTFGFGDAVIGEFAP